MPPVTGSGGSAAAGGAPAVGGLPASACEGGQAVQIENDSNYSLVTKLDISQSTLKGNTDLLIDWTGLTQDFFGHAVHAPEDIKLVLLTLWNMSPEEIEGHLSADTLDASLQKGALSIYPDGTFTTKNLFSFGALDPSNAPVPAEDLRPFFDTTDPNYQYPPSSYTFLAIAQAGTNAGSDARMLHLFKLDSAAAATTLELKDGLTTLMATASFAQAKVVEVPVLTPQLNVDWSRMTKNALGNVFVPTRVTKAVVAHFETETTADLEGNFLDLQSMADAWYEADVKAGTSIGLETLSDAARGAFPGISEQGLWMTALFCTKACSNPAPWSITMLKPCGSAP